MHSRIIQKQEDKAKTRLILTILGSLIIIIILIKFGIDSLINLSLFINKSKISSVRTVAPNSKNINQFVGAPTLLISQTATNSATIEIKGNSTTNETIYLYKNNSMVDQTTTDNNGNFDFKNETLDKGVNNFTAQAQQNNSKSPMSDVAMVTYINLPPSLIIASPNDNQNFSHDQNPIQIVGKTDPNVSITVNGFIAQVDVAGNYSYTLNLNNGNNAITIDATDQAGNKTEKVIHVNYTQ